MCHEISLFVVNQRNVDLLGWSPLLVWLELVVVVLSVDRSLEARAERSRGSTGASSASGEDGASHAQPSARASDHTANTTVNIVGLSSHAPPPTPAHTPTTLSWQPKHRSEFTLSYFHTDTWNGQSQILYSMNDNRSMAHMRRTCVVLRRAAVLVRDSHARAARTTLGCAPSRWHTLCTMHSCYRHYW